MTHGHHSDSAHLDKRPVGSDDLDDDHHGDADHGGQGQSPAECDGPVGILVDLVVRQRLVFDQREDEAALSRRGKESAPAGNVLHVRELLTNIHHLRRSRRRQRRLHFSLTLLSLTQPFAFLRVSVGQKVLHSRATCFVAEQLKRQQYSYHTEQRSDHRPTPLHPGIWSVAQHVF